MKKILLIFIGFIFACTVKAQEADYFEFGLKTEELTLFTKTTLPSPVPEAGRYCILTTGKIYASNGTEWIPAGGVQLVNGLANEVKLEITHSRTGNDVTIQLTGAETPITLSVDDGDSDPTNELDNTDEQDLSLVGNILSLENDPTSVDLSKYMDNTDDQSISIVDHTITLENGGSVVVPDNVDDADNDPTNELDNTDEQSVSFNPSNGDLSISGGSGTNLDSRYIKLSEKGVVNGVASLDGSGKIYTTQLPSIALTDVYSVGTIAIRDGLIVDEGDVAIVTDRGDGQPESYIFDGIDWVELKKPADNVASVNGQTGTVTLTTSDIVEGSNKYYTTARVNTDAPNVTLTGESYLSRVNQVITANKINLASHVYGTLNDINLSSNVPLKNVANLFSGINFMPINIERTNSTAVSFGFKHVGGQKYLGFDTGLDLKWGSNTNADINDKIYHSGNANIGTIPWNASQYSIDGTPVIDNLRNFSGGSGNFSGNNGADIVALTTYAGNAYFGKKTGNGSSSNLTINLSNGFIGINKLNATAALDVAGNSIISGSISNYGTYAQAQLSNSTSLGTGAHIRLNNSSGSAGTHRSILFEGQGNNSLMAAISCTNYNSSGTGAIGQLIFYTKASISDILPTPTLTLNPDKSALFESAGTFGGRIHTEISPTNSFGITVGNNTNSNIMHSMNALAGVGIYTIANASNAVGVTLKGDGTGEFTSTLTASNFILGSDKRLKDNISDSIPDLESIDLVRFNYKSDSSDRKRYGVIAQDLQKIAPEMVYTDTDSLKTLRVAYFDFLIAKMANKDAQIKELQDRSTNTNYILVLMGLSIVGMFIYFKRKIS